MQNANVLLTVQNVVRVHIASSREMSTYEVFEVGFEKAGMEFNLGNIRAVFNVAKEPEGLETIAAELARFNDQELTDEIRGEAGIYVEEDGLFYMEDLPELREEWIIAKVVADPPIDFNSYEDTVDEWKEGILNEDWHHEIASALTTAEIAGEGMEFNTNNINAIYPYYTWDLGKDGELVNNPVVMKTVEKIYQNQIGK